MADTLTALAFIDRLTALRSDEELAKTTRSRSPRCCLKTSTT